MFYNNVGSVDFDNAMCIDSYGLFDRIDKKSLLLAYQHCLVCPCLDECKKYSNELSYKEGIWAGEFYYLNQKKDLFTDNNKIISIYPFKRIKKVKVKKSVSKI